MPHAFIRRGQYDWDDPAKLVGSLVAQLEEQAPGVREPEEDARIHPAARLAAMLARLSASEPARRGERLVILVDGLDNHAPGAVTLGAPAKGPGVAGGPNGTLALGSSPLLVALSGGFMRRNRFDHLAKEVGQAALGPSGRTLVNEEINSATQYADLSHAPDPARKVERDRLGLLGRLAADPCLIEVYSEAPGAEEFRACLAKHLASWQGRAREHKKRSESQHPRKIRRLLPLDHRGRRSEGRPDQAQVRGRARARLAEGRLLLRRRRPPRGIVVASELPGKDPTTLLVRIMAAGPLLAQAVEEMAALPPNAYERVIAEPALLSFQHLLGQDPSRSLDDNEKEFIMAMIKSWEEGRAEARAEGRADALLTVLHARGIAVPDAARERILAQRIRSG